MQILSLIQTTKWSCRDFQNLFKNSFFQIKVSKKAFHIVSHFNLNVLDYDTTKKVQNFLNLVYQNGMIPTKNKPLELQEKQKWQLITFPLIV